MMTAWTIAIVVLGSSLGDVLTTRGMKEIGEIRTLNPVALLGIAGRVLSNRWFLAGLFSMTVSFLAFLAVLSWADLSLVLPATSIGFVVTAIGAKAYLRERVSPMRWTGIVLVCGGVALILLP